MAGEWLKRLTTERDKPRELHTAEEIRAEVQRRVDEKLAELGDDAAVEIQPPYRYAEPDPLGHNWAMHSFTGDPEYFKLIGLEVVNVQAIWNLA